MKMEADNCSTEDGTALFLLVVEKKQFCHLKIYQRRKENKGLEIKFSILSGKI